MKKMFCTVVRDHQRLGVIVHLGYKEGNDTYYFRGGEFHKIDQSALIDKPTLRFFEGGGREEVDIMVALVDGLIAFGAKPTKPLEDTSQLKAVSYHLEDMRSLVFKGEKEK